MTARMNSKKRVTAQTDLDGQAFAARKKPRPPKMGKMLSGLAKHLVVKDITETGVTVGWNNGRYAGMARVQHTGDRRTMTKKQLSVAGEPDTESLATRRQARALIDAGYKARWGNFRGLRTPSIKWITENLTIAKASIILRVLRGGPKESWEINLPARSFLGITDMDMDQLREQALALIEQAINEQ
ncbi:MAG: hypothetical protein Q8S52_05625 [Methylobacter sp.]|nr:hypothetical protein [Methylobacter sp.]MDP3361589.1 hypothetical protein [Methylobacter sp.]